MTKGGFPMTINEICIKFLLIVSLFLIGFGFMAWALLMDAVFVWFILCSFVLLLLTVFAEWVEQNRY